MKNYSLKVISILLSLITGIIIGKYTSDSGRYTFNYFGSRPILIDTKTGDVYGIDESKVKKSNYKEIYELQKK